MNKKIGIIVIFVLVVIGIGFFMFKNNSTPTSTVMTKDNMQGIPGTDTMKKDVDETMMMEAKQMVYMYEGALVVVMY